MDQFGNRNGLAERTTTIEQPVRPSLARLLEDEGLVSHNEVEQALNEGERTGERLGEVLLRWRLVEERQLAQLLARRSDLPFTEEHELTPDGAALEIFSPEEARRLEAVPVRWEEGSLRVVVVEPTEERLAELRARIPGDISFSVVTARALDRLLIRDDQPVAERAGGEPDVPGFEELLESLDDETAQLHELSNRVQEFAAFVSERDRSATRIANELAAARTALEQEVSTTARLRAELEERGRALEQESRTTEGLRAEIAERDRALEEQVYTADRLRAERDERNRLLSVVREKLDEVDGVLRPGPAE